MKTAQRCSLSTAASREGARPPVHSQHTQPLQPTEHPAPDRVDLIGREVELDDRRRPFKGPVLDLRDLVVAEVTVERGGGRYVRGVNGTLTGEGEEVHLHLLQLGKALKGSGGLQGGDVIVVEAAAENKWKCS